MSMSDPLSDMLTRIRNGQRARMTSVTMPSSRLKLAVVRVLEDEGYIGQVTESEEGSKKSLTVELKYHHDEPVIEKIERVSRPGLRIYRSARDLPKVQGGLGVAIVSTSSGVMSDRRARAEGHGGEVLCFVS